LTKRKLSGDKEELIVKLMMVMMFWVCDTDIKPAVTDNLNGQKVAKSKNSSDSELVPSCISSLSYGMLTGKKLVDVRRAQCARTHAHN